MLLSLLCGNDIFFVWFSGREYGYEVIFSSVGIGNYLYYYFVIIGYKGFRSKRVVEAFNALVIGVVIVYIYEVIAV